MSYRLNRAWIIVGVIFFATENMALAKDLVAPDHISPPSTEFLKDLKNKNGGLMGNMRTTKLAAEYYALDHSGKYPTVLDNTFKAYFPMGHGTTPGNNFTNPFTGSKEWPLIGKESDVTAIDKASFSIAPGVVEYIPLAKGKDFLIIGGGINHKPLRHDLRDEILRLRPSK